MCKRYFTLLSSVNCAILYSPFPFSVSAKLLPSSPSTFTCAFNSGFNIVLFRSEERDKRMVVDPWPLFKNPSTTRSPVVCPFMCGSYSCLHWTNNSEVITQVVISLKYRLIKTSFMAKKQVFDLNHEMYSSYNS